MKNERKTCCGRLKTCLSEISIGQYNTKLYYKGRESQSSSFGGLMTILCAIILIAYSFFMILSILKDFPGASAKIKIDNSASLELFKSCGFEMAYYIYEPCKE